MTTSKLPHACTAMRAAIKEDAVCYWPEFREYLIPIPDGGSSGLVLTFCPWCGETLPRSKRGGRSKTRRPGNQLRNRRLLRRRLTRESRLVAANSMHVLEEFEAIEDLG